MNKVEIEQLLKELRKDYITLETEIWDIVNIAFNKEQLMLLICLLETLNDNYYGIKMCVTGKE